jgi:inosose dehydratase
MTITKDRIAINPIQWLASPDGLMDPSLEPPLEERLKVLSAVGISGLHAEIPDGVSPRQYQTLLSDVGMVPAPGYFTAPLPTDRAGHADLVSRAGRVSEQHAALGLKTIFLASSISAAPQRLAHPAVGFDFDAARLAQASEVLAEVSTAMKRNGVKPALHPHVGGWVETEHEARHVLDTIDADLLDFGPDIGHLGWAGADYVTLLREYASRVAAIHVKDYRTNVAAQCRAEGRSYGATVLSGLWAEPGYGTADITSALKALPPDFAGWLVIEVDRGTQPTPEASIALCGKWAETVVRDPRLSSS